MKIQIAEGIKEDINSETAMCVELIMALVLLLVTTIMIQVSGADTSFTFNNGFQSANLTMDGISEITSNGLLHLTNETRLRIGHAFYPNPIVLTNTSSFSTTFVFSVRSAYPTSSGHGLVFVISPTKAFPGARPSQYLGLFNETSHGDPTNHVFAVELDITQTSEFGDINDNHVGIDVNDLISMKSTTAGYYVNGLGFQNLTLKSGHPIQVWVDYDGSKKQIDVTLAPINMNKPETPLLKLSQDLSHIINNPSYVGFSSSTGSFPTSHYVLGWSFKLNGEAQNLQFSKLPKLPRLGGKKQSIFITIGLPLFSLFLIFLVTLLIIYYRYRKRKFYEIVEPWEENYGPHRLKYKDLYTATKGFAKHLGSGGFGEVYEGTMPGSNIKVAVKKISHGSRQGIKEFIAEIVSIGRLRHRNLVPFLGYCKRKSELLLVYEFMPYGSLDKYLFNQPRVTLNWMQRFRIIKGVASGLCYLHQEWEQVIVHRDIKAGNVLLDSEFNGRIGDFGLARLYDHGSDPATASCVVGTRGYIAPENFRTSRATTKSDVFAFGVFMLEVVCGRRPTDLVSEDMVLVDWVYALWNWGEVVEAKDPNFGMDYNAEEVELVLKLGLLCSNSMAQNRPSMHQVVQYLNRDVPLPDFSSEISSHSWSRFAFGSDREFDAHFSSTTIQESILSGGR